jgi:hypothetical protein
MRIILRLISIVLAIMTVLTLALALPFVTAGGLQALLHRGLFGYMTILGWGITMILGPLGSIQLWRFKPIGWLASALVFAFSTIYYAIGVVFFRNPAAPLTPIILQIGYHALFTAILATKSARSTCKIQFWGTKIIVLEPY